MKNQLFLLTILAILAGWNPAAVQAWELPHGLVAVQALTPAPSPVIGRGEETEAPTPVPSATPGLPAPDVLISDEQITTYMYWLDLWGRPVWYQTGEIDADQLMLQGRCLDGYAQVEYRDPERPGWWLVEFVKCDD